MTASNDAIVQAFAEALRKWAELQWHLEDRAWVETHTIDTRQANRLATLYSRLAGELSASEEGRSGIEELLEDDDAHVRVVAAVYASRWRSVRAREVLQEVSATRGLAAINARYALRREWGAGG